MAPSTLLSLQAGPTCTCSANTLTLLAGFMACGPAVVALGVNASTVGLGPALFQQYTAMQNSWNVVSGRGWEQTRVCGAGRVPG